MKIQSIEAIPFSIPLYRTSTFAHGSLAAADHVLIRVRTEDGVVGHAEAPARPFTYGESQRSIVAAVEQWFSPALVGTNALAREQWRARMSWLVGNNTCRAAIDMAVWDVIGQSLGKPVHQLLGGFTDSLTVAHIVFASSPEQIVDEVGQIRAERGITHFKVKTGRDPGTDTRALELLREKFGDSVELYVDANKGWTSEQAVAMLPVLVDHGVTMVEEPSPAFQPLGRRRVAALSTLPVVGDESVTTLGDVATQILAGHVHMVSIKTARTGFTESQRIVGLCEGLGVGTVIGSQLDGAVGTYCALAFGAAFPSTARHPAELDFFMELRDDIVTRPLVIEDGRLRVPTGPGLGMSIDETALAKYRSDT